MKLESTIICYNVIVLRFENNTTTTKIVLPEIADFIFDFISIRLNLFSVFFVLFLWSLTFVIQFGSIVSKLTEYL